MGTLYWRSCGGGSYGGVLLVVVGFLFSDPAPVAAFDEPSVDTGEHMLLDVPTLEEPFPAPRKRPWRLRGELRSLDDFFTSVWDRENLTGDWDGGRAWLIGHGITPEIVYTAEVFSNVHGGVARSTRTLGNLDLTVTLDSGRLGWWKGGTFFLHGQSLMGQSDGIQGAVGSPFDPVSNLNASERTQLSQYSYAHEFLNRRLAVKIGKQDANIDFVTSHVTGGFINGGIRPPPNIPLPTFPDPAPGLALFLRPAQHLSIAGAVYGGDPDRQTFGDGGLFSGETFSIVEIALERIFAQLGGNYRAGAWLLSVDTPELGAGGKSFDSNYGFYLLFDQGLYRESSSAAAAQGLDAFVQLAWAPSDRNPVKLWVGGGLVYTGFIASRDRDEIGVAVACSEPTGRSPGLESETVLEWFYQARANAWLRLQPDVQYFVNPGGNGRDALALGLRAVVKL